MPRSRRLASLVFTFFCIAAVAGCSSNDSIVSTDSPTPVVAPGTSSAQCTPPTSACVLAASDVSADTGVAISVATTAVGASASSLMAASQGVCEYGTGSDGGGDVTVTASFSCGLGESTSSAYVSGYKDQVATGMATQIVGLGDYAVWIPNGTAGSVAALQGNAFVTVAYDDATGSTSPQAAQASAAAVAKGYLTALF